MNLGAEDGVSELPVFVLIIPGKSIGRCEGGLMSCSSVIYYKEPQIMNKFRNI